MKSPNPFFSFWLKVVPVILMFLLVGFTGAQAQNYLPLNDATAAVEVAIDALKHDNSSNTPVVVNTAAPGAAQKSGNSQLKAFEISYFGLFIDQLKSKGNVAEAVQALDAILNTQGQPQTRAVILNAARGALLDLITY